MKCLAGCGFELVPDRTWKEIPREHKVILEAAEITEHMARGLCRRCYEFRRLRGTHLEFERLTMSRDELLAEWDHFTKDRETFRQNVIAFAEHLDRSWQSVEKALTRAGIRARNIHQEAS